MSICIYLLHSASLRFSFSFSFALNSLSGKRSLFGLLVYMAELSSFLWNQNLRLVLTKVTNSKFRELPKYKCDRDSSVLGHGLGVRGMFVRFSAHTRVFYPFQSVHSSFGEYIVLRPRLSGSKPPLPHTPLWRSQENICYTSEQLMSSQQTSQLNNALHP